MLTTITDAAARRERDRRDGRAPGSSRSGTGSRNTTRWSSLKPTRPALSCRRRSPACWSRFWSSRERRCRSARFCRIQEAEQLLTSPQCPITLLTAQQWQRAHCRSGARAVHGESRDTKRFRTRRLAAGALVTGRAPDRRGAWDRDRPVQGTGPAAGSRSATSWPTSPIDVGTQSAKETVRRGASGSSVGSSRVPRYGAAVHPGDDVIPVSAMRRAIAEHMVRSERTAPHATVVMEVDMTGAVAWRACAQGGVPPA